MQWIRIGFPDGSVHENTPGTASPWEQVLHPLPVRDLAPGTSVGIGIGWSRDSLWIDAG